MVIDVPGLFELYDWSYDEVDAGIWRATFTTDWEEEFDLYVALSDDWIHFAVSPFIPLPRNACAPQLHNTLLHLNQKIKLARFSLDEDGDVNLLIDLPLGGLSYSHFAVALDILVDYTRRMGQELSRIATEIGHDSPLFED